MGRKWGVVSLLEKLGPHLTQSRLGRGVLLTKWILIQTAVWPQQIWAVTDSATDRQDRQGRHSDSGQITQSEPLLVTIAQKTNSAIIIRIVFTTKLQTYNFNVSFLKGYQNSYHHSARRRNTIILNFSAVNVASPWQNIAYVSLCENMSRSIATDYSKNMHQKYFNITCIYEQKHCNRPTPTYCNTEKILQLECGTMPNVMAAQPNIGGAVCESSVIPFRCCSDVQ